MTKSKKVQKPSNLYSDPAKIAFLLAPGPVAFFLITLGFLVYLDSLGNSFHLDDRLSIIQNPSLHDWRNLKALLNAFNTRLFVGFTFALNYAFGKLDVFGYHFFNILVHSLSAFLLYTLVVLSFKTPVLEKSPLQRDHRLIGLLAGLVFLTHPIQTQAVTYVWQRAASLATFFYLMALVFYIRSRLKSSWIDYTLSLASTILGMFSKEITFTLPVAILLYECFFFHGPSKKKRFLLLLPFLLSLLIIPLMLLRAHSITNPLMKPEVLSDLTRFVGEERMPRKEYLLTQIRVTRTYLRLFLFPMNQNLDYDYPLSHSLLESHTLQPFLLLLGILGTGVFLLKKHRLVSFGVFWFFLALSVEALVPQQDVIFEHRMYLAMAGLSIALSYFLFSLAQEKHLRSIIMILLVFLIASYSFLTYKRNGVWRDELSLWDDVVKKSPHKTRAYWSRGDAYKQKGDFEKAIADYNKAITLSPYCYEIYINRGIIYKTTGHLEQAISNYDQVIKINPRFAKAYYNRGNAYQEKGDLDKALLDYNKALTMNPLNTAEIYNNRSVSYFFKKEYEKSWEDAQKSISMGYHVHPGFIKELKKKLREK